MTRQMHPDVYAIVRGKSYRWVSFDLPYEITEDDGIKRLHLDEEDAWCDLVDETTGERLRLRFQDKGWHRT
jgi:hypothetical protein